MKKKQTLIVIGGGAAGFFCAVNAAGANPNLKVTIVEKTSKLLSKVRVSGGGRCNVTHACFEISNLVKRYPRGANFLKKTFHQFNTTHCVKWFEDRGVKLKTEADGRMFSITDNSQTIIDCLLREADKFGVEVLMNADVKSVRQEGETVRLELAGLRSLAADYVCVACGGYPKSSMFDWLKALGHTIEEPVPSLFTFNMPGNAITKLMGVSVEKATVKIVGSKLSDEGPLLITHWGMSGPAILKLSAWGARELANRNYHFNILINWLSNYNEQSLREEWQLLRNEKSAQKIGNRNPFNLPTRLWIYLLNESGINEEIRWADLPGKEQNRLIKNLTAQEFEVKGKTTFKEEFVTCGGIKLTEVDANTMESRLVPHLFFAGEILDVDGVTGGFNFQHAWTSGWIAAKAITQLSE
ncbi:NAD(P)/FAD-dependent oxidoreductase [Segetibacter sp.]|jgi:predicted Rossmann fold flavoprotein|uniref:NAD(P)/FAD-dependent oxidoreductase n=1 Tax=Segetibacter sp. TaxID=2231182 RepID=UPI00262EC7B2|nr:NAD(P)/FAD-dependent oxidoreductase [Segetibacter sp.]MCW3079771.1 NAD(P)/FAD-dependent oxidoreductase [Segetibacter sp.]